MTTDWVISLIQTKMSTFSNRSLAAKLKTALMREHKRQQVVSRLKWPERKAFFFSFILGSGPMQIPSHTRVYTSTAGCWTVIANKHRHWKAGSRRTKECKSEVFTEKNISEVQND